LLFLLDYYPFLPFFEIVINSCINLDGLDANDYTKDKVGSIDPRLQRLIRFRGSEEGGKKCAIKTSEVISFASEVRDRQNKRKQEIIERNSIRNAALLNTENEFSNFDGNLNFNPDFTDNLNTDNYIFSDIPDGGNNDFDIYGRRGPGVIVQPGEKLTIPQNDLINRSQQPYMGYQPSNYDFFNNNNFSAGAAARILKKRKARKTKKTKKAAPRSRSSSPKRKTTKKKPVGRPPKSTAQKKKSKPSRGRPVGSTNKKKPKTAPKSKKPVRGRPVGSTNKKTRTSSKSKSKKPVRGRPVGSKTKKKKVGRPKTK